MEGFLHLLRVHQVQSPSETRLMSPSGARGSDVDYSLHNPFYCITVSAYFITFTHFLHISTCKAILLHLNNQAATKSLRSPYLFQGMFLTGSRTLHVFQIPWEKVPS